MFIRLIYNQINNNNKEIDDFLRSLLNDPAKKFVDHQYSFLELQLIYLKAYILFY